MFVYISRISSSANTAVFGPECLCLIKCIPIQVYAQACAYLDLASSPYLGSTTSRRTAMYSDSCHHPCFQRQNPISQHRDVRVQTLAFQSWGISLTHIVIQQDWRFKTSLSQTGDLEHLFSARYSHNTLADNHL